MRPAYRARHKVGVPIDSAQALTPVSVGATARSAFPWQSQYPRSPPTPSKESSRTALPRHPSNTLLPEPPNFDKDTGRAFAELRAALKRAAETNRELSLVRQDEDTIRAKAEESGQRRGQSQRPGGRAAHTHTGTGAGMCSGRSPSAPEPVRHHAAPHWPQMLAKHSRSSPESGREQWLPQLSD